MAAKGVIHPDQSRIWAHYHLNLNHIKQHNKNIPDDMDLIINFLGLWALVNESHHRLEFLHTPRLESRRVMEDEPWVALEGECTTNVMDPRLQCWSQLSSLRWVQKITEPAPLRSVRAGDEDTMRVGYHDKPIDSSPGFCPCCKRMAPQSCCTPAWAALFFQH